MFRTHLPKIVTGVMIFIICGLQISDLWRARRAKWEEVTTSLVNLHKTLSTSIDRNLSLLDLSLIGAQEAVQLPGVMELDPELRRRIVFDRSTSAQFMGALLILDAKGEILIESEQVASPQFNLSDRDYFVAHKSATVGLYVSKPLFSRIRSGEPTIVLSRRLNGPDGTFQGIAMAAIRIAYFQSLFEGIDLGEGGVLRIDNLDGTVIFREPPINGAADIGAAGGPPLLRDQGKPYAVLVRPGRLDGVERLYVSGEVGGFPLTLTVGTSVSGMFAGWNTRALVTGALTFLVCTLLAFTVAALTAALRRSEEMEAELERLAVTDPLTGLPNRRALDLFLAGEVRRARREDSSLSLLMIDVDHFKTVNDRFGHAAGDIVLRQIGQLIAASVRRAGDFTARFGGEEFVVVLPATTQEGAVRVAEGIRSRVEAARFLAGDGAEPRVTVSIGVATASSPAALEDLIQRSDIALYQAKNSGRNRVSAIDLDKAADTADLEKDGSPKARPDAASARQSL